MNRRPIKSRNSAVAHRITRWLAGTAVMPNHISMMSMVFAAMAGLAFSFSSQGNFVVQAVLLLLAAFMCQARLLCNLFDGMLATEAGKSSSGGAVWNEFPDRIADIFILAGLGFAIDQPALGWAAAAMAVLTAYIRELGSHITGSVDFSGPMAKPHRMAVVTVASLLAIPEAYWFGTASILRLSLWLVFLGALYTGFNRLRRLLHSLH